MWSLYEEEKFLKPKEFSNGKNQKDIVKEVLDAVEAGERVIFIHGVCGTGKSAIALNIARKLGKASIVVPGKNLQEQYKKDYESKKHLKKEDGKKLKISIITGRNNHKCKFLENNNLVHEMKREVNGSIGDIFGKRKRDDDEINNGEKETDTSADNPILPCKIEIKEKNWWRIKKYLEQNNKVDHTSFDNVNDVRRANIASVCPYWSPVLPDQYDLKSFPDSKKTKYKGLDGTNFVWHQGKCGCSFYDQFKTYIHSDVIVFNALKYKLETAMNRKPSTEVEIIDECDEFLDGFSNQRKINIDRLQNSLMHIIGFDAAVEDVIADLSEALKEVKRDAQLNEAASAQKIISLKKTPVYDVLKILLDQKEIMEALDQESYVFNVEETARMFEESFDDTYLTVEKEEGRMVVSLVTTNLAKKFQELVNKNKILVLMSGTLHSSKVLKDIFGITKFKIIEAETEKQGDITIKRTGLEMDCRYSNFSAGRQTRKEYLEALDKCVKDAPKPSLVHVNAFQDIPSEEEKRQFNLPNLPSREGLIKIQSKDKTGVRVEEFKKGEIDILFSTRDSRGIDFPGNECRSIIFTKYPNPNVQDAFWKILMETKPNFYWEFYKDKATRELWQKIYRGLRFKEDHVYLLSPDIRVLDAFEEKPKQSLKAGDRIFGGGDSFSNRR